MKLLREKYKTWEGADKRARFENGIAGSEYRNGYKAQFYRYRVVDGPDAGYWRVERLTPHDTMDNSDE